MERGPGKVPANRLMTGVESSQSSDRHLQNSGKLIVICSPTTRHSQYVNDDIRRLARSGKIKQSEKR